MTDRPESPQLESSSRLESLRTLHVALVDVREGYLQGVRSAEADELGPLYAEMAELHGADAEEVAALIESEGGAPDRNGSAMGLVHRAVIFARSAMGGLDESALDGVIDGEKRLLDLYDEALSASEGDPRYHPIREQAAELTARVFELEVVRDAADAET